MGYVREKLLDFKRRLSDRKMYSITITVITVIAIWGIVQYKNGIQLRQQLDNQYNRAFFDMQGYVQNVETLLLKSMVSTTPERTAATLQEAWRQANLAQTNLGQLPVSSTVLSNTSKFLTQVGDFSYSLDLQNMNGKQLTTDQYNKIEQLHGFAVSLEKSLNGLQNQLTSGRIKWGQLARTGTKLFGKKNSEMAMQQFENLDKTFQSYPTLIYDGPFSDHMVSQQPKGLTGDNISQEKGKEFVKNFLGSNVQSITSSGKDDKALIKTYSYNVKMKGADKNQSVNIDVTQKGGHILWMLNSRSVPTSKLNMNQAKDKARKFLEDKGIRNMVDTYYLTADNTATINFAYKQDDVVIYPDQIKVKVALDNGEIVGFESKAYLAAHTNRTLQKPKITVDEAKAKLSKKLKVNSQGMAIIPTESKTELLCYEFKGKLDNNDFLVYINALTGKEEQILMIVNTPNGVLTM